MARGPAPQSDALKRARGNPGKRKLATPAAPAAPAPAPGQVGDAKPSPQLQSGGREVWNALAPELAKLNVLRGTDSNALSRYCADIASYWEVSNKLQEQGLTYKVTSNHGEYVRINPLVAIQDRLNARLVAAEDRFGLSPQARQQLMVRAAHLASQGNLFAGSADGQGAKPPPAANPIGLLGAPPTQH